MANASKDPLWRAKVSAEVAVHPSLQSVIEDKCTTCHAPMGRTEAIYHGTSAYSIEEMEDDGLALDGVSCAACHQIADIGLGTDSTYSGRYVVEDQRVIYGPYESPLAGPMAMGSGFTPVYSEHIRSSELCATCHTLFTPFVDNEGQIAGELPEQTAYLEWRNSVYADQGTSCQDCHMPAIEDPVIISLIPPTLAGRSPFWKHDFVGGNAMMLRLMGANIDELEITAEDEHFDSTLARTIRQLEHEAVELSATYSYDADSLSVWVKVENKTGHKLPTGFPSRRAWIHTTVQDGSGSIVFESGAWDASNGTIIGDTELQPHYRSISNPAQTQIYQSVMGDVDGDVTWVLLRGAEYLKDNRLPPRGFRTDHPDYQHTSIGGAAALDPDFNHEDGLEGSGSDVVEYRIPGFAEGSEFSVEIEFLYQSVAPSFVQDLLAYDTEDVEEFGELWNDADNFPAVMRTIELRSSSTNRSDEVPSRHVGKTSAFPNPFTQSTTIVVNLDKPGPLIIEVLDVRGRMLRRLEEGFRSAGYHEIRWNGLDGSGKRLPSGLYLLRLAGHNKAPTAVVRSGN
jgi:hypothetical protein